MTESRSITVANDDTLMGLIQSARSRLLVLAPGLSARVADCLCQRWQELGPDRVTVILDLDPEVYRLGYGDVETLALLERVAAELGTMLQRQPGIRIGVVLADEKALIYSPTPRLIEAGPASVQTPNAVSLESPPTRLLADLGCGENGVRDQVVGLDKACRSDLEAVEKDLEQNPPQRFDIARKMRVFNTAFEFVEFELKGTMLGRHTVTLPKDLSGIADAAVRQQLQQSFHIVPPGSYLSLREKALKHDRDLIAKRYLRSIKNYGTVVMRKDKAKFCREVKGLEAQVKAFGEQVRSELQAEIDHGRQVLHASLLPLVERTPPQRWLRSDGTKPDEETLSRFLDDELRRVFGTAQRYIKHMTVRLVFKGVTYESLTTQDFLDAARQAIPQLEELYEEYEAVRGRDVIEEAMPEP